MVLGFFIAIIYINIKKNKESQQSILLRIIANYLQLLTAAMSFNLRFPDAITDAFEPARRIGSSSEVFLSFDCFVSDTDTLMFAPSNSIFKMLLTAILPIFLILMSLLIWMLAWICFRKCIKDIKRNIVITAICIIYLLHPMLTKVGLEIFQCVMIDENEFRVKIDIEMKCYSSDHMFWSLVLGVPILAVYSIGCPTLLFIILYRNRKRLNTPRMKKYYLMMYQGLKPEVFYWEIVNTARKVIMIVINVSMSTIPVVYTASTTVIALVIFIRIQITLQPYKLESNNLLEIEAMVTGIATLF